MDVDEKKKRLEEKREKRQLKKFIYMNENRSFRNSTREIMNNPNFYKSKNSKNEGEPKDIYEKPAIKKKLKHKISIKNNGEKKKRGRKKKIENQSPEIKELEESVYNTYNIGNERAKNIDLSNIMFCEEEFDANTQNPNVEALNQVRDKVVISDNEPIQSHSKLTKFTIALQPDDETTGSNQKHYCLQTNNINNPKSSKSKSDDSSIQPNNKSKIVSNLESSSNEVMTTTNNINLNNNTNNNTSNNDFDLEQNVFNEAQNLTENHLGSNTYINCDVRYFNFDYLVNRIGQFDVIMLDPPWRIKGAQKNDSGFMFSNSKFNLEYNTMSNNEILSMPLEKLSKKGFCFLWVLNSILNVGYECLNKWGYEVVDQITWVKTRNQKICITQGYYFLHSSELCLVGYKCQPNEHVEYKSKVASNIFFSNLRGKSQKPIEIYELIEKMMPGSKKIEIFARNNNLREGWLSLGNQLGENYQSWKIILNCDNCKKSINTGIKRYKSRLIPNYDICEYCFIYSQQSGEKLSDHSPKDFFVFNNNIDEEVLHHYFSCNVCNCEPIWGNRFTCEECENYDLCETCFDKLLSEGDTHINEHKINNIEIPLLAGGMNIHNEYRCKFCYQKPITGPCFLCNDCKNFVVCQNCYFNSYLIDDIHFKSNSEHRLTIVTQTKNKLDKFSKW